MSLEQNNERHPIVLDGAPWPEWVEEAVILDEAIETLCQERKFDEALRLTPDLSPTIFSINRIFRLFPASNRAYDAAIAIADRAEDPLQVMELRAVAERLYRDRPSREHETYFDELRKQLLQ